MDDEYFSKLFIEILEQTTTEVFNEHYFELFVGCLCFILIMFLSFVYFDFWHKGSLDK